MALTLQLYGSNGIIHVFDRKGCHNNIAILNGRRWNIGNAESDSRILKMVITILNLINQILCRNYMQQLSVHKIRRKLIDQLSLFKRISKNLKYEV